jgi:hemoglobin
MFKRATMMFLTLFGMLLVAFQITPVSFAEENPATEEKTLYERLGGEPAIKAVIDEFVTLGAADPKVNFVRKGTDKEWQPTPEDLDTLKKHLVQFVSVASGATDVTYEGRDMKSVHEGMKISNVEFDALAGDLKAALDKFNVPEKEQNELLTIVGTTRGQIVEEEAAAVTPEDKEETKG